MNNKENKYIIETENLSYVYPDGSRALENINIKIKKGERIALMGENGSGKSTLFRLINGLLKPESGRVLIDGEVIKYSQKSLMKVRKKIGIVFQNPDDQLFSSDVRQDISFGLFNLGMDKDTVTEKVDNIIKVFGMKEFERKPVQFLSGGQKKRVAVSDVSVMEPDVILFDEPSAGMDPANIKILDSLTDSMSEKGITVITATHNSDKVLEKTDRVIIMKKGGLLYDGKPETAFYRDDILKAAGLEKPSVLKIYDALRESGITDEENIPKDYDSLEKIIREAGKKPE